MALQTIADASNWRAPSSVPQVSFWSVKKSKLQFVVHLISSYSFSVVPFKLGRRFGASTENHSSARSKTSSHPRSSLEPDASGSGNKMGLICYSSSDAHMFVPASYGTPLVSCSYQGSQSAHYPHCSITWMLVEAYRTWLLQFLQDLYGHLCTERVPVAQLQEVSGTILYLRDSSAADQLVARFTESDLGSDPSVYRYTCT